MDRRERFKALTFFKEVILPSNCCLAKEIWQVLPSPPPYASRKKDSMERF